MKATINTAAAILSVLALHVHAAGGDGKVPNPDFTKGDTIPAKAKHDWNLGATGLRGWIYTNEFVTYEARQVAVTKVEKRSPSDGVINVGDVILGVGGKAFAYDPRTELGKALTAAEAGDGNFKLTRWRAGATTEVVVKLPPLGSYSVTAPYDCPKSKRILEAGCKALAKRMEQADYTKQDPIPRSLNALALLASGEEEYMPLIRREARWAADFTTDSYQTWYYAYVIMLLSEYHTATGDDAVMPGLKRLALEAAEGQSKVGSWGHRFAKPDGRLSGYGMMNAPGLPLTISLIMARQTGLKEPAVDLAIERSSRLLRFYIGKGAVPYGDHMPWLENHEDNGKCGMAGVMFNLLGEKNGAYFFSRMSLAAHGAERDGGHTGNYFNILWSMPGVALAGPQATGAWMKEFGAWYFDLARAWDGEFRHLGPPEPGLDSYHDWDATGGYLLAYAMPLKKIMLTGKQASTAPQVDATAAQAIIQDGRGWDNKDRFSAYDKLSPKALLECLASWSPVVRERAAMALARRKPPFPMDALIKLLESPDLNTRYGACEALQRLGGHSAPAVDALITQLSEKDIWLRIKATEALCKIGEPAAKALPVLLRMLPEIDTMNDPRGMQQRCFSAAIFDRGGQMLKLLAMADQAALSKAVQAGLQNQDGHARSIISSVYKTLSLEQIKPLFPAIYQAIITPAPSGEMFAEDVRIEGLRVLAKHRVKEGIDACVKYAMSQNPWSSENRTPEIMEIILTYGTHAKAVVPELEKVAHYFEKDEKDFPPNLMIKKANSVRDTIAAINASTDSPELMDMK
ncbi:MAG: DUF6288 domain-containing protein [Prosthecobacter sp.]|uniref:DUF6288 domain-containing protein n=1 Tax=Prosthecobacter sp. TaxID=1965333 RepID=UPI0038FDC9E4